MFNLCVYAHRLNWYNVLLLTVKRGNNISTNLLKLCLLFCCWPPNSVITSLWARTSCPSFDMSHLSSWRDVSSIVLRDMDHLCCPHSPSACCWQQTLTDASLSQCTPPAVSPWSQRPISDRGGGAWSERAGTESERRRQRSVASSGSVSGGLGVVVRYRGATAVIMIGHNGEKWTEHGLRLLSTSTEIWTGRKDATAF